MRRCPRLGGPVSFEYCRTAAGEGGLPCFKVMDCWWEIFDIEDYLRVHLSAEDFEKIVKSRPKPKLQSLVELIQEAQNRVK